MAIIFDRDFGRVWSDGSIPYIFSSIVRVPPMKGLKELTEMQLGLIKEIHRSHGDVYSILDLRLCPVLSRDIVAYYFTSILVQQFRAGVKHNAIVKPHESSSAKILVDFVGSFSDKRVSFHDTFEDALKEVNRIRLPVEPPAIKSIFGFLERL